MLKSRFTDFQHHGEVFRFETALLADPRCQTFAAIGVTIGAGSLLMGGLSQAGVFGGQPQYPNTAASSAQMAETEAELLPIERQMQAEAQLGGTVTLPGFTRHLYSRRSQKSKPSCASGSSEPQDSSEVRWRSNWCRVG